MNIFISMIGLAVGATGLITAFALSDISTDTLLRLVLALQVISLIGFAVQVALSLAYLHG